MGYFLRLLYLGILLGVVCSCGESSDNKLTYEELQKELEALKATLANNTKIANVEFVGKEMVLTFGDGTVVKTGVPGNIIPQVGENGNWFINGVDLGVKAEAKAPTVGTNGNWFVGDVDTGVKAEGTKGEDGKDGTGIKNVTYDEERGMITINLTDGTKFQFILSASEKHLSAIKLGDLNGAYVLKTIYNGDLPFAQFVYDSKYNMTSVAYYQNVANEAVKVYELSQEFNSGGKITKQTTTEYADRNKMVSARYFDFDEGEYIGDFDPLWSSMTAEQIFDKLFPADISGRTITKVEVLKQIKSRGLYDQNYAYNIREDNEVWEMKILPRYNSGNPLVFYLCQEGSKLYCYTTSFHDLEGEFNDNNSKETMSDLSSVTYNYNNTIEFVRSEHIAFMDYYYKFEAFRYTGAEDEKTGISIVDYYAIPASQMYNPGNLAGNFKILKNRYTQYAQGDIVRSYSVNYSYNGNNINIDGGATFVMNGTMVDRYVVKRGGKQVDLFKFKYNEDGNLLSISSPYEGAENIIVVQYDAFKNPVELQGNVAQLAGKGYEEDLCTLGLAYKYEVYDETLGCVVEKYKYAKDGSALVKINYDQTMKNFMNHTFTAMNPMISGLKTNNAISEMLWAGHGSYFMMEYQNYNEGGYPTKFKGVLQVSPIQDEIEYPVNGSVATLYKLQYEKKK